MGSYSTCQNHHLSIGTLVLKVSQILFILFAVDGVMPMEDDLAKSSMDMDDVPELLLSPTGSHVGDKPLFPETVVEEKRKQKRQRMGMGKLLL